MERFNGKLKDACLYWEWFVSLRNARVMIEPWRTFYNYRRLHSLLGDRLKVTICKEHPAFTHLIRPVATN